MKEYCIETENRARTIIQPYLKSEAGHSVKQFERTAAAKFELSRQKPTHVQIFRALFLSERT